MRQDRRLVLTACAALLVGGAIGFWCGRWRPGDSVAQESRPGPTWDRHPQDSGRPSRGSLHGRPVYRLPGRDEALPGRDVASLHRLHTFLRSAEVTAAECYKQPNAEGGPTDVYLLFNAATVLGEIHLVSWYRAEGGTGPAYEHRVAIHHGPAIGGPLLLLDIDNRRDGERQIIFLSYWHPVIVDFRRPPGQEIVQDVNDYGIPDEPWTGRPSEWTFADLDGDGTYEAVAAAPVETASKADGRPEPTGETVYLVYRWRHGRYEFAETLRTDPTPTPHSDSRALAPASRLAARAQRVPQSARPSAPGGRWPGVPPTAP